MRKRLEVIQHLCAPFGRIDFKELFETLQSQHEKR
jgi:hypothetical protein